MTVEKRLESNAGALPEAVGEWMLQFQKLFELYLIDAARDLPPDADESACPHVAVQALKLTLLDSGMDEPSVVELFDRAVTNAPEAPGEPEWNSATNDRRLALIDQKIQGKLTRADRRELSELTRLMRNKVDTEANVPLEGARALHRHLLELRGKSMGTEL